MFLSSSIGKNQKKKSIFQKKKYIFIEVVTRLTAYKAIWGVSITRHRQFLLFFSLTKPIVQKCSLQKCTLTKSSKDHLRLGLFTLVRHLIPRVSRHLERYRVFRNQGSRSLHRDKHYLFRAVDQRVCNPISLTSVSKRPETGGSPKFIINVLTCK